MANGLSKERACPGFVAAPLITEVPPIVARDSVMAAVSDLPMRREFKCPKVPETRVELNGPAEANEDEGA